MWWTLRAIGAREEALLRAKEVAEVANSAKDQFLAALSHELRTPLTPVLATLTAWERSREFPAEHGDDLQMVRRNLDLKARRIDDLLDLTRIVKGKLSLTPVTTDVEAPVRAAELNPAAGGGRMRIVLVEDHLDTARVLSCFMRANGHEVRVAHTVADAARVIEMDGPFDFLLRHIGLPDGRGSI